MSARAIRGWGWTAAALVATLTAAARSRAEPSAGAAEGLRGALITRGEAVLFEADADRRLSPASVLKVLVAAAALEVLGPDYRAVTRILADEGSPAGAADGTLAGDLVVVAGGDPTWNERFFPRARATDPLAPLAHLADAVAAAGVRRVAGDLVVDLGAFPGRDVPPGRALSDLAYAWAAPTSGLAVEENAFLVRIAPGDRVGAPGRAEAVPPGGRSPRVVADIRTVGAERHGVGTVDFLPLFDGSGLLVRGEYPLSEPPYEVAAAVPDPVARAAAAVRDALARRGIEIAGGLRIAPGGLAGGRGAARELARVSSPPLAEWLAPMLRESHNWYAEMLVRHVALAATGAGRIDDGLEAVRTVLESRLGAPAGALVLADGSGISADDLVTARAVVRVLEHAWRRPWRRVLVEAMATPGRGTLAAWSAAPPMAAKTGTRRGVQALAGYLDPEQPEPTIFAVLLDHRTEPSPVLRAEILDLLRQVARASEEAGRLGVH